VTKLKLILFFTLVLNATCFTQSIKRHVLGSLGSFHQGTNIKVNTTFGQPPNAGTINNSSNYLRQGFQQPLCLYAPQASISIANDTQCLAGNSFSFNYPLQGDTFTTYRWNFGADATPSFSISSNPQSISFTTEGVKNISLILKRGICTDTAFATVMVIPSPSPDDIFINVNTDTLCEGDSATIIASDTIGATVTYNLYDAASGGTLVGTSPLSVSPAVTTTYYVEAVNQNGCINTGGRIPVTVYVNALPAITLTSDRIDNTIIVGETIVFTAAPSGYDNYEFFVNGVSKQVGTSNTYTSNELTDNDTVSVTATNNGCKNNTEAELIVDIKPFPNAFTPNGDGKNDVFLKGYDLTILNRWGQELYSGNSGWDGYYNGQRVSPGTYYYILKLQTETIKGNVAVVGK